MTMPTIARIVAYSACRYNESSKPYPELADGFARIMVQVRELRLSSEQVEGDMLDWLSKPHADHELRKACTEVLIMLGTDEPGATI